MNWSNANVSKKVVDGDTITIWASVDEEDKDFKKTRKVTWISADPENTVELNCVELGHLITKPKLADADPAKGKEADKVEDFVNSRSKVEYKAIAESCVKNLQKGAIFQFMRRGMFIVDKIPLAN